MSAGLSRAGEAAGEEGDVGRVHEAAGSKSASPVQSNYKLQQSSPCKNAGQSSQLPYDVADLDWNGNTTTQRIPFDLDGDPRKVEFVVDIGAYETPIDTGPQ